ncbi:hypothetical protein [Priestia megaterium]|uniref:hypothetical protein n=1 Tax=Priestia megaterium TaxID=1404 RepID=UPI00046F4F52|nr:hypothetical protein [Priestia megaterium]
MDKKKKGLIFIAIFGMVILTACSEQSSAESKEEKSKGTKVVLSEENQSNNPLDSNMEKKNAEEEDSDNSPIESLTFNEFIEGWNKIEPNMLDKQVEEVGIDKGLIVKRGGFRNADSYLAFLAKENKNIHHITLNLTYPSAEETQSLDNLVHDMDTLIQVLEPDLSRGERTKIIKALGITNDDWMAEVSVRLNRVAYTMNTEDDRLYITATYKY